MGCGQGALITPNQTLALMDVDPLMGSAAGGVLQTGQRIGLAIGQAVIGTVFFNSLSGHRQRVHRRLAERGLRSPAASSRWRSPSAYTTSCARGADSPRYGERVMDPRALAKQAADADRRR